LAPYRERSIVSEWVLNEEKLAEARERALDGCRRSIREAVDRALDEFGVVDQGTREAAHARLLEQAWPYALEAIDADIAEIRARGRPATWH
jgi:hypothetical protein